MGEVIIVGSSDSMLSTEKGKLVDQFNIVCRFNRAPTEGYQSFVGSKTTHRFCNLHVAENQEFPGQDMNFIPSLRNQKILTDADANFTSIRNILDSSCDIELIDRRDEFIRTYRTFGENLIGRDLKNLPSSGLGIVCYFINMGKMPVLYGFDIDSDDPNSSPHYWWNKKEIGGVHDFSTEREILRNMFKHGKIGILK